MAISAAAMHPEISGRAAIKFMGFSGKAPSVKVLIFGGMVMALDAAYASPTADAI
jgi:hypothetical protein